MVAKRTRSTQTRDAILRAAGVELLTHGSAGLRVDAVSTRAGINKRMIYAHFLHREGLVEAVLVWHVRALCAAPVLKPASRLYLEQVFADELAAVGHEDLPTLSPPDGSPLSLHALCRVVLSAVMLRSPDTLPVLENRVRNAVCADLLAPVLQHELPAPALPATELPVTELSAKKAHESSLQNTPQHNALQQNEVPVEESVGPSKPRFRLPGQTRALTGSD